MNKYLVLPTALLFFIHSSCSPWRASEVTWSTYRVNDDIAEDTAVMAYIAPYKEELGQKMNVELVYSEVNMEKGKPESTLTNWFVDAMQQSTSRYFDQPVDFCIQNYGGIRRTAVGAGPITIGTIYEIMPFDNRLVVLTMLGEDVEQMLTGMASSGGWPISFNVRCKMDVEQSTVSDITINGEALVLDKAYRVGMPDFVANGGDRLGLDKSLPREDNEILLRDAVIEELRNQDTIRTIPLDGRIQLVNP